MSGICVQGNMGSGICTAHETPIEMTGTLIATSTKLTSAGLAVGTVGDIILGNCGHTGILTQGSSKVTSENKGVIRVGDPFVGDFTGTMIEGSLTITSG